MSTFDRQASGTIGAPAIRIGRRPLLAAALTLILRERANAADADRPPRKTERLDNEQRGKMPKPTTKTITVDHVTIPSTRSFAEVREHLERSLSHMNPDIVVLLRYDDAERAHAELEKLPALSIFGSRDHGALLAIAGRRGKAIQYDIGNMITASLMTRHDISAALYAPIRVLLREDRSGAVAFEYDRPSTTFGQFGNADVTKVAMELDRTLEDTLQSAAE